MPDIIPAEDFKTEIKGLLNRTISFRINQQSMHCFCQLRNAVRLIHLEKAYERILKLEEHHPNE